MFACIRKKKNVVKSQSALSLMIELLTYTAHNIVPIQNFQYQAILGKKANFITVLPWYCPQPLTAISQLLAMVELDLFWKCYLTAYHCQQL